MIFVKYDDSYKELLERYFNHPSTPINNASHKLFKTHLYNGVNGILGLLIDNNEIVATVSAIVVIERGIYSIKYPHRLHVRKDYSHLSNMIVNKYWDPLFFDWLINKPNDNLYCTFNEGNYTSFMWSAVKHKRRLKNEYVNEFGKSIISRQWYILDKMVEEMGCPQYIMYSNSISDWFYPWRVTYDIPIDVATILNSKFKFVVGKGWLL